MKFPDDCLVWFLYCPACKAQSCWTSFPKEESVSWTKSCERCGTKFTVHLNGIKLDSKTESLEGSEMNWKWPMRKTNNYKPWYQILRACLFFIPFQLFRFLAAVCVLLGNGRKLADRFMENTR